MITWKPAPAPTTDVEAKMFEQLGSKFVVIAHRWHGIRTDEDTWRYTWGAGCTEKWRKALKADAVTCGTQRRDGGFVLLGKRT